MNRTVWIVDEAVEGDGVGGLAVIRRGRRRDDFDTVLGMIFNDDVWRPRRGSQFGRIHINHDREEGHAKITRNYFDPNPTYPEKYFLRHFWMHTSLFLTITKVVERYDD